MFIVFLDRTSCFPCRERDVRGAHTLSAFLFAVISRRETRKPETILCESVCASAFPAVGRQHLIQKPYFPRHEIMINFPRPCGCSPIEITAWVSHGGCGLDRAAGKNASLLQAIEPNPRKPNVKPSDEVDQPKK